MTEPTVVIAPDSLKGSCSSPVAAAALARGARAALGPGARVVELPLADGGEGTLDALAAAWGGRIEAVQTTDALGRPRAGRFGISPDGRTAIIEAAEANGLPHVQDQGLRPLDADSAGVGLLVLAALRAGARELLLCVGGSATSDGGAGMLRALGARFLGADGRPVAPGARGLADLATLDLTGVSPAAQAARWRIACDVDAPLTGPAGAAHVFGPQKGAGPAEVAAIDAGLARLARLLEAAAGSAAGAGSESSPGSGPVSGSGSASRPGMGAAGGLGLGPAVLFGAELVPGAELVADAAGLDAALADADLVLTGEGRLDAQSLGGKVVSRVVAGARAASATSAAGSPIVVIAGAVELSAEECRAAGIAAAISIARGPAGLTKLRRDTEALLEDAAAQVCGLFAAASSRRG
ncbi:glycerate kinase [Leucobacter luti]|uniref:glycerate kinase n=1 Tax=Leucobacter luti TaxID=340320 RepID=UPI003D059DC9